MVRIAYVNMETPFDGCGVTPNGTQSMGTIMKPVHNKDLEVSTDASFCGDKDPKTTAVNRNMGKSRFGHVSTYVGYPLLWKLNGRTEIAVSTTERECIGMS